MWTTTLTMNRVCMGIKTFISVVLPIRKSSARSRKVSRFMHHWRTAFSSLERKNCIHIVRISWHLPASRPNTIHKQNAQYLTVFCGRSHTEIRNCWNDSGWQLVICLSIRLVESSSFLWAMPEIAARVFWETLFSGFILRSPSVTCGSVRWRERLRWCPYSVPLSILSLICQTQSSMRRPFPALNRSQEETQSMFNANTLVLWCLRGESSSSLPATILFASKARTMRCSNVSFISRSTHLFQMTSRTRILRKKSGRNEMPLSQRHCGMLRNWWS